MLLLLLSGVGLIVVVVVVVGSCSVEDELLTGDDCREEEDRSGLEDGFMWVDNVRIVGVEDVESVLEVVVVVPCTELVSVAP